MVRSVLYARADAFLELLAEFEDAAGQGLVVDAGCAEDNESDNEVEDQADEDGDEGAAGALVPVA